MGIEWLVMLALLACAFLGAVIWQCSVWIFSDPQPVTKQSCPVCLGRERAKGPWRRVSAHLERHEGPHIQELPWRSPRPCKPCVVCKHSCLAHERLITSSYERHLCHVPGCGCTEYRQILLLGES